MPSSPGTLQVNDLPVADDGPLNDVGGYLSFLDGLLRGRGISRREFADRMGYTKAWATMILRGRRRLQSHVVDRIAVALTLTEPDRLELKARVDISQSKSKEARFWAERYLRELDERRTAERTPRDQMLVLSRWYVGALFELAHCEGYRPDPKWIAATLRPRITPREAEEALEALKQAKILDEQGEVIVDASNLGTEGQVFDKEFYAALLEIHKESFSIVSRTLDRFNSNERHVSGGIVALTDDAFESLRDRLHEISANAFYGAGQDNQEKPTRLFRVLIGILPASLYTDTEYDPAEVED